MINGITLRILAASIFHTRLECEISMKALDELEITLYRIWEEPISIPPSKERNQQKDFYSETGSLLSLGRQFQILNANVFMR